MESKRTIKFNSVTQALHAQEILAGKAIRSKLVRTPKLRSESGCGYTLVVNGDITKALDIIRSSGIRTAGD